MAIYGGVEIEKEIELAWDLPQSQIFTVRNQTAAARLATYDYTL